MMKFVDVKTLIMNQGIVFFICASLVGLLWWQNRSRFAGLGLWVASFAMQPLSMALIFFRGTLPDWLSIIIGGHALLVLGAILMYLGMARFVGRAGYPVHQLVLLAISMVIPAYFTFVYLSLPARNVNLSLILGIIHAETAWLMLTQQQPELRVSCRRIGIVQGAFVLTDIARIFANIFVPSRNDFFNSGNTVDAILIFSYQIVFFTIVPTLFLATNHRLFSALQTQQRQLEVQNLELRKLWLAVEKSGNAIVITNQRGEIEYANPSFEQSSGYQLSEVIGKTPGILKSGEQSTEVYQQLWQTITNGQTWRGEFHNRRKDGTLYWEDSTIAPVQDNDGHMISYIAIKMDITERKAMEADLEKLATTDALTNVFNRRQMTKLVDHELERAQRYRHPTAAIILDIDFFKRINDEHGHAIGDLAIKHVAQVLRANLRSVDYLGRYGGDEFTIVLPNTGRAEAGLIAERLRSAVEQQPLVHNSQAIPLSISLGVACMSGASSDAIVTFDAAIHLADQALYNAKAAGRNCYRTAYATALSGELSDA